MNLSGQVDDLFLNQFRQWELARINYGLLDRVLSRTIDFGEFQILVQFNPERIRSSAAKVDARSIEERPCFLCSKNRPAEQKGLPAGNNLTILINPFPIFSRHLTIVSAEHTNQRILNNFSSMLDLARSLNNFVIFYNGPECGASAPDHFHFQAGNRGFLPIESDFLKGRCVNLLTVRGGIEIFSWHGYKRGIATLRGKETDHLCAIFERFYAAFRLQQPEKPEPMLNILAYAENDVLTVHIIPRILHRPSQFFAEGEARILLSPASVDLGGVVITPREEDFNKITADDISDIFSQVCMNETVLTSLLKNIE
jgi:hypothetical protein